MKYLLQTILRNFGYELRKQTTIYGSCPAAPDRPIGYVHLFLEDIKSRGFNVNLSIDVGAHLGGFTKLLLGVYPEANAVMIEPLDETQEALNALCSQYSRQLKYIKAGAGSKPSYLNQNLRNDLMGASFLMPDIIDGDNELIKRRTKVITLNDLVRDEYHSQIPDLVKIDVQGFELEVLKGATYLLGKTEMFVLEVSFFKFDVGQPLFDEIVAFMQLNGYVLYDIVKVIRRPLDGALGQLDVAFVKEDGLLRNISRWA